MQVLTVSLCVLAVHPSIYKITGNTVSEGGNVTLKCFAEGEPTPSIVWRRLSDNSVVTMPLVGIRRHDVRNYSCTAKNGVGIPASREVYIDVQCECMYYVIHYNSITRKKKHGEYPK